MLTSTIAQLTLFRNEVSGHMPHSAVEFTLYVMGHGDSEEVHENNRCVLFTDANNTFIGGIDGSKND